MTLLNVVTVVCIGLLVGVEFAVSAFINPVLWKLDARAQAGAIRMFAGKLGFVMPFWYAASLVFLVVEAMLRWHSPAVPMLIAAAAIWAAVIVLTLIFLVPINNRMAKLDEAAWTTEDRRQHKHWDRLHRARIVALGGAMVCMLFAVLR
jgi:uncharacterized membrane protein